MPESPQPPDPRRNLSRRTFLAAALSLAASGCRPDAPRLRKPLPERPNFVVLLSDALRADHLSCYGYPLPTSPAIGALAARSLLFERCYANATWTLPATASVLTGLHPLAHRTVVPEWAPEGEARGFQHQILPDAAETTAEALKARGYRTGFFQANPNASPDRGLARGADRVWSEVNAGAETHVDALLDWIQEGGDEPFYAYAHLIDPHEPYAADPAHFEQLHGRSLDAVLGSLPDRERIRMTGYHQRDWNDLFLEDNRLDPAVLRHFAPEAIAYLSMLYDTEIRRVDRAVERLLAFLADRGLDGHTVVVLTSDHGEAFGEDGHFYHGSCLHDPQLHVPLIIALPNLDSGARIPWSVEQRDIHATLLALADATEPFPGKGMPLLRRDGAWTAEEDRPVVSVLDLHRADTTQWDLRMTLGDFRLAMPATGDAITFTTANDDGAAEVVPPDIVPHLPEGALRDSASRFLGERQRLLESARGIPDPAWKAIDGFDPAAFRAMGYL